MRPFKNNNIVKISLFAICSQIPLPQLEAAELDCMVKPEMYIELSSPVRGVLEKVFVNKGDRVVKGQPVAQLENSFEVASVNKAKWDAANNSEINNRKAQLEFAQRSKARYQELFLRKSVSQSEKDKIDTEMDLAAIELKRAIENKKTSQLALEIAKAQLELKTIKSPIDGVVIDRYAMVGESVSERAIMKLAQINPLRIELIAPTAYFGLVYQGMEAEIRPERPANKSYKASVTQVDQIIDPASGSFTVRMSLPNPGDSLVAGVNCVAQFSFPEPLLSDSPANTSSKPVLAPLNSSTTAAYPIAEQVIPASIKQ